MECSVCFETPAPAKFYYAGKDPICKDCTVDNIIPKFEKALQFEREYPVKFGPVELDWHAFQDLLGEEYGAKLAKQEKMYATPRKVRVFCQNLVAAPSTSGGDKKGKDPVQESKTKCLAFLGSRLARSALYRNRKCDRCGKKVCGMCGRPRTQCKADDGSCAEPTQKQEDEAQEKEFEGLVKGKDYQLCPKKHCGAAIYLGEACNHVKCPAADCATEFCFICATECTNDSGHWDMGSECPRYGQPGDANAVFDQDEDEDEDEWVSPAGSAEFFFISREEEERMPWDATGFLQPIRDEYYLARSRLAPDQLEIFHAAVLATFDAIMRFFEDAEGSEDRITLDEASRLDAELEAMTAQLDAAVPEYRGLGAIKSGHQLFRRLHAGLARQHADAPPALEPADSFDFPSEGHGTLHSSLELTIKRMEDDVHLTYFAQETDLDVTAFRKFGRSIFDAILFYKRPIPHAPDEVVGVDGHPANIAFLEYIHKWIRRQKDVDARARALYAEGVAGYRDVQARFPGIHAGLSICWHGGEHHFRQLTEAQYAVAQSADNVFFGPKRDWYARQGT
jgi:hypothetical protein